MGRVDDESPLDCAPALEALRILVEGADERLQFRLQRGIREWREILGPPFHHLARQSHQGCEAALQAEPGEDSGDQDEGRLLQKAFGPQAVDHPRAALQRLAHDNDGRMRGAEPGYGLSYGNEAKIAVAIARFVIARGEPI